MTRTMLAVLGALACAAPAYAQGLTLQSSDIKPNAAIAEEQVFKVEKLDLPPTATASLAGFMVNANSLGKATLTGKYGRSK